MVATIFPDILLTLDQFQCVFLAVAVLDVDVPLSTNKGTESEPNKVSHTLPR